MSEVKKVRKTKSKNLPSIQEANPFEPLAELSGDQPAAPPKQRKSRAKPKPTNEEAMQMLLDGAKELGEIIQDLKDDKAKVLGMNLKKTVILIDDTIMTLEEDKEQFESEYAELKKGPVSE